MNKHITDFHKKKEDGWLVGWMDISSVDSVYSLIIFTSNDLASLPKIANLTYEAMQLICKNRFKMYFHLMPLLKEMS